GQGSGGAAPAATSRQASVSIPVAIGRSSLGQIGRGARARQAENPVWSVWKVSDGTGRNFCSFGAPARMIQVSVLINSRNGNRADFEKTARRDDRGNRMESHQLRELLEQVRAGKLDVDLAARQLQAPAVVDLGFAHVDLHRRQRCGFPEVIFCEGKTSEWVTGVVRQLAEAGQHCLATRVNAEQAEQLAGQFPQGRQDRVARTFWLPAGTPAQPAGKVVVLTAGTSDLPVAREAVVTAEALGTDAKLIADVGVAGIHR